VNQATVALREGSDVSKTHRRADCHDQGALGHGGGEGVEGLHRFHSDETQHKTCREQDQTRFNALDQGINRHKNNGNSKPFKQRHENVSLVVEKNNNGKMRSQRSAFYHRCKYLLLFLNLETGNTPTDAVDMGWEGECADIWLRLREVLIMSKKMA
jgi:hypothetical protein